MNDDIHPIVKQAGDICADLASKHGHGTLLLVAQGLAASIIGQIIQPSKRHETYTRLIMAIARVAELECEPSGIVQWD